ncbi:uncharacterized protein GGS25DRAFT_508702 [Hypoxylon fragiforme]|uniref:uncharacterized protein n=1 Tax=Hypoxylon fragiforme TaxID=63214 RepID=UPI0020C5F08D|nr:uncharacterized protein GGS25DRAFT_508702 [Hypoxylon fragiforme]KAI2604532.1 hypothetical protein GGS25DRAFT_508702 [Hypoxylon fragiforme]
MGTTTTSTTPPPPPTTYTYTPRTTETLLDIATAVIHLLTLSHETLGVAESLTAGGVMSALTSVPGASACFRGGVVSYATPLKQQILGVDAALIAREGVIHADVAEQMASGVRRVTSITTTTTNNDDGGDGGSGASNETTWGIGTTGVAGPTPQDGKPVGMVYIGIAGPEGSRGYGPFSFEGTRERIREATVMEALSLLRQELVARKRG